VTKAKISEYSATAGDNTDVNGTNIAEGCAPSGINDAIREVMAALKRFETGADGDSVTVGGNLVVSGSTTANTLSTNLITEKTSASGVTIDGVLLKDNGVVTGAGTVSAPVYSTTGDLNTGIFFPAADTIAFAEGGAEAMRIDSSGNVGIGTTTPTHLVTAINGNFGTITNSASVLGSGNTENIRIRAYNSSNNQVGVALQSGASGSATVGLFGLRTGTNQAAFVVRQDNGTGTSAETMRIDSSGNVGIGTNSPTSFADRVLQINGPTSSSVKLSNTNTSGSGQGDGLDLTMSGSDAFLINRENGFMVFSTNDTERVRIESGGLFYSLPTYNNTTGAAANMFVGADGVFARSTSSIKYKTNIEDLDHSRADAILNFRPIWYRSTTKMDNPNWSWYGLIAEEVAEIEPRLVFWGYNENDYEEVTTETPVERERTVTDEAGNETTETYTDVETKTERKLKADAQLAPEGVQYERLTVLLLDIVKRQNERIETLEAKVSALEGN
jgi:hypothetical protein